jgi:hypothetical protein
MMNAVALRLERRMLAQGFSQVLALDDGLMAMGPEGQQNLSAPLLRLSAATDGLRCELLA